MTQTPNELLAESRRYFDSKFPNFSRRWRRFHARKRAAVISRIGRDAFNNIQGQIRSYEAAAWSGKETKGRA